MKKSFALMLVLCLLLFLSGCFAEEVSFFYTEYGEQDGFDIAINRMASCCFIGPYECAEYTENMQITIPDEYNGIPVTRLGGYYGQGVPTPFQIRVDMRTAESEKFPDFFLAEYSASSLPVGSNTEDLLFYLHIGKNLKTVEFVNMDSYQPFFDATGKVIYYHPVVYVTCSEENPYFYAEDGRLYHKETGTLVVEFAYAEPDELFTRTKDGTYLNKAGTEYVLLAHETDLCYLGQLVFQGSVSGEEKTSQHLGYSYQTGFFSIENDETMNILIRYEPNDEWFSIYRKTSLSPFDFSADNCSRLELVPGIGNADNDVIHTMCSDGITDKSEIAEFLLDVRSQPDPHEAGLYDLVRKHDGTLENCYMYAVIYGFFEEAPNLAVRMDITSYNDLAYSVSIEDKEYVLPEIWLRRLQDS